MSKLKNIFGIPQSLIDVANEIHETSHLSPKQKKIAKMAGDPNKIDAEDFKKLRKESSQLDELSPATMISYAQKASASKKPGEIYPKRGEMISKAINKADQKIKKGEGEVIKNSYEQSSGPDQLIEFTGTYPFKANEVAPLIATLRMLLNFLASSPSLKKIMKEETNIDEQNVESFVNFLEIVSEEMELLEYRTKGAVGKKKAAAAASSAPAPKKSDDEEGEEDEGPAYEAASGKDQEHIMTQLKGAMDDERGGRHIDTSSGKKYVTKSTASKIHSHLMGLKAPERAQSSSDLYNLKATHPMTKHIHDDHRASLEKGIKAPSEKKGRGRPKKAGM